MGDIPVTRKKVSLAKEKHIRKCVRETKGPSFTRMITGEYATTFFEFIKIPEVNTPIYSIPRPITLEEIQQFITDHTHEHMTGDGLLLGQFNEAGQIQAYFDLQFWPQLGACEIGGGMVPQMQNHGRGTQLAQSIFSWVFESIGVNTICETAALDNERTKNMLGHMGFTFMGEVDCVAPSGRVRRSNCWEITHDQWRAKHSVS